MSGPGLVSLASLRVQSQERSDQLNSSFLSVSEWNRNIQGSYKELYDLLVAAYGSDYYVGIPIIFSVSGQQQLYPLPNGALSFTSGINTAQTLIAPAFYKLLGVDLQLSPGNPGSYVTIRRFNFSDRNRYAVPNFQSFYGVTNLRYRLDGDNIWFTPVPAGGQSIQMWYVPAPTDIQPEVICGITASSATVTCTNTSQLAVGMQVQAPALLSAFATGTKIATITANVSFTTTNPSSTTSSIQLIRAWDDSTLINGISGWEEYVVLDAALKAMGKEESDASLIGQQKMAMKQRLVEMAENRDAANPATVGDTQSSDFQEPNGWGNGWGVS